MGKGFKRRPGNLKRYNQNYDEINWKSKKIKKERRIE